MVLHIELAIFNLENLTLNLLLATSKIPEYEIIELNKNSCFKAHGLMLMNFDYFDPSYF